MLQVVPEDYVDEGQGNELVDGNEDTVIYNLPVKFCFISTDRVHRYRMCRIRWALNYVVSSRSRRKSNTEENGNVACGETASWNEIMSNDDNSMDLGDYQVAIELTNGGTPVQANWNYRFEIIYNF